MSPKLESSKLLLTVAVGAMVMACNGGEVPSGSTPTSSVADVRVSASSELPTEIVASATITITSIDVVPVASGTRAVSLFEGRQTIDTVGLSSGGSIAILATSIPAGTYGQARVSISGPATIQLADGRTFTPAPSGEATVTLPLVPPLVVATGSPRVLLFLLDLASSFPLTPSFALVTAQVTNVGFSPVLRALSGPTSPGALNGRVFSSSGEPVAGASVKLAKAGLVLATTTSAADGSFTFDVPTPGSCKIEANASGFASTSVSPDKAALSGVALVSVRLNADCGCGGCKCSGYRGCGCGSCGSRPKDNTGTIQGTVTSAGTGAPIAGASVRAMSNGAVAGTATTAAEGTFSIPGLTTGRYEVAVDAALFSSDTASAQHVSPHEATTVLFRLDASRP